jgi:hypothetical protein
MESMRENKALLYSLLATGTFIFLLACGLVPELSEQFGIIEFPPEVCKIRTSSKFNGSTSIPQTTLPQNDISPKLQKRRFPKQCFPQTFPPNLGPRLA